MIGFKLAGGRKPTLLADGIKNYDLFTDLGYSISRTSFNFKTVIGATQSEVITVSFATTEARDAFAGFELVSSSPYLTYSQQVVADTIELTITYNPTVYEQTKGHLYLLINNRWCKQIKLRLNASTYSGEGVLQCDELLNFPDTDMGDISIVSLPLTNSSVTLPLVITALNINSELGFDFAVAPDYLPAVIPPSTTYNLPILFSPRDNSVRVAAVTITSSKGVIPAVEIAFMGRGFLDGVTKGVPLVSFTVEQINAFNTSLFSGNGITYKQYLNTQTKPFLILSHTFTSSNSNLMYPELINGTVISAGETIGIPVMYDHPTLSAIPEVGFSGYYLGA